MKTNLMALEASQVLPVDKIRGLHKSQAPLNIYKRSLLTMLNTGQMHEIATVNQTYSSSWIILNPLLAHIFTLDEYLCPDFCKILEARILEQQGQKIIFPQNFVSFVGTMRGKDTFELSLSQAVCDTLIINDIMLCDPNNGSERMGNRVFDTSLNLIQEFAQADGYQQILLTAAFAHLVPVFAKRGFELLHCVYNRFAMKSGQGFIMYKNL